MVEGIDGTSYVTVGVLPQDQIGLPTAVGIPSTSKILVKLLPYSTDAAGLQRGRAYLHWEISSVGPKVPTTTSELSQHIFESINAYGKIVQSYAQRLQAPYNTNDVEVAYVDTTGAIIPQQPAQMSIQVVYPPDLSSRTVLSQGSETAPGGITCNVDIGNYIVVNGNIIQVTVDSTIVKLY